MNDAKSVSLNASNMHSPSSSKSVSFKPLQPSGDTSTSDEVLTLSSTTPHYLLNDNAINLSSCIEEERENANICFDKLVLSYSSVTDTANLSYGGCRLPKSKFNELFILLGACYDYEHNAFTIITDEEGYITKDKFVGWYVRWLFEDCDLGQVLEDGDLKSGEVLDHIPINHRILMSSLSNSFRYTPEDLDDELSVLSQNAKINRRCKFSTSSRSSSLSTFATPPQSPRNKESSSPFSSPPTSPKTNSTNNLNNEDNAPSNPKLYSKFEDFPKKYQLLMKARSFVTTPEMVLFSPERHKDD